MTADAVTRRTCAGLFMLTLATLMYEILLTRVFSATMWYHFAFVAISVAMFGMTVGAIIVYLFPRLYAPERAKERMASSAFYFAITIVLSFLTQLTIPFLPNLTLVGIYTVVLTYAVISVPFVFSGIAVCLALTKFPRRISSLYAADLAGAAFGCILLIYALKITDAPTAVFVVAFLGCTGAVLFAWDGPMQKWRRRAAAVAAFLLIFSVYHTVRVHQQRPLIRLVWVMGYPEMPPLYEKWNSFSRLRVYADPASPGALRLVIDTIAETLLIAFDGDLSKLEYLKSDISNLCHHLRQDAKVLIVGSGGGKDVLSALVAGQKEVVGVELNEEILKTANERFGDYTGHLDRLPNVTFVNDEARSYVTRSKDAYDIIQISMIDTWAATAAGAFVLSENSLYTVEAWTRFLEHLTDDGLLTLTRWYFSGRPGEALRLASLAQAALKAIGVTDTREHIMMVADTSLFGGGPEGLATILVSRSPFTPNDIRTIEEIVAQRNFILLLTPRFAGDPVVERIASGQDLEALYARFPINIAPPTDDSPFFFHMLRLRDVFRPDSWQQGIVSFNMKAVVVLAALLATVFGLTFLCIIVPLLLTTERKALRGSGLFFVFFAAIGFGFMLVEISQLQRLIIFLGHPTYGLSVVLFALLLSSGLGSYLTRGVADADLGGAGLRRLGLLLAALVLFGAFTPKAIGLFAGATTPVRILVSVALLFPLGLFMGMAFPLGMRLGSIRSPQMTPWLWGINGATSVCASVAAVAIALSVGITATFWTGFACYSIATGAFLLAGE